MGVYNGKCIHCEQDYRVKVTTQCPEAKLCDDIAKRVQSGQLDFRDGAWINSKLPNNTGDMARDDYVAQREQDATGFIGMIAEFMEALDKANELKPEANDELTDEDIDLLKNVNSVPLPAHIVMELNLPVDQLVSLHKLQRLNYVNLFGGSHDQVTKYYYKSTNKGKKFLKPKPVTLTMSQLYALASIGDESMLIGDVSGYGIWAEVEYLKKLDMVHQKSGKAVISTKGYDHLQKLLAVLV